VRRLTRRAGYTFLVALVLLGTAQARIAIEQAQRELQGRYQFVTSTNVNWPACSCSPAPAFPKDKFYGDLDNQREFACQLVQDLAIKFYGSDTNSPIYPSFIRTTNGISGLVGWNGYGPFYFAQGDFPLVLNGVDISQGGTAVTNITITNFPTVFTTLRQYIEELTCLPCDAGFTNVASHVGPACTDTNCQSAIDDTVALWGASDWSFYGGTTPGVLPSGYVYVSGVSLTSTNTAAQGGLVLYSASLASQMSQVYAPTADQYPCLTNATLYLLAVVAQLPGGPGADVPPAPIDGQYHIIDYQQVTWLSPFYLSPYFGGQMHVFAGGCSVVTNTTDASGLGSQSPAIQGWTFASTPENDPLAVLVPVFSTDPDDIDCGGNCAGCQSCASAGGTPGQVCILPTGTGAQISLGPDSYGGSAGYLYFHADHASALLSTPSALLAALSPSASGSVASGLITTPNVQASITSTNSGYIITLSDTTTWQFLASVTVLQAGGNTNQLLITQILGTNGNPRYIQFNYNPTAATWTVVEGGGLRNESRATTWTTPTNRTDVVTVTDTNGLVATVTTNVYVEFPWGRTLVQRTLGTAGIAKTTTWTYFPPTNGTSTFGQLQQLVEPGGRWEQYLYDAAGRLTNKVAQFGDSAVGSSASLNRVTQILYLTFWR